MRRFFCRDITAGNNRNLELMAGVAWKTQKPLSIPNLNNLRSSLLPKGKSKLDMKGS